MATALDLTPEHIAAVLLAALAALALCAAARRWPGRPAAAIALGAFTAGSEAAWIVWLVARGAWTPAIGLPLHLCDAAAFLAAAALWTRRRALVELLWFWAMAGTVQALVTPDAAAPYPDFLWLQYYAAHGGIVVAALLLVVGLRIAPRPGAWARAALLTAAYAAGVGAVDALTGGDYLFLRQPPATPSLLDVLGPWPWYLVSSAALAIGLFLLLQAPFRARNVQEPQREAEAPAEVGV